MSSALILGKTRIEALSDGVFSISMTLLVLKLEVPEVMHHTSNEAMLQQMLALAPAFGTYMVTFLIAGTFWIMHHLTFHFLRNVDKFLLWVNLLFLMMVSLLPFSAGLMSHLLVHPVSQLFYFGNQLAIAVLLNLHWQYAIYKGLAVTGGNRDAVRLSSRMAAIAIAFAACLMLALWFPAYSWIPFPLVRLAEMLYARVRRSRLQALH